MNEKFIREVHSLLRDTRQVIDVPILQGKKYPRFDQIALPAPDLRGKTFAEVLEHRKSATTLMQPWRISLTDLASILGSSLRVRKDGNRPHPSGGGRYPLETYIFSFSVETLARESFHYEPNSHSLERLWSLPEDSSPLTYLQDLHGTTQNACAIIILTAQWERTSTRYSSFALELALMEAGHIGQNIQLSCAALGLSSRPFAGFHDRALEKTLRLDARREQPLYTFAVGNE